MGPAQILAAFGTTVATPVSPGAPTDSLAANPICFPREGRPAVFAPGDITSSVCGAGGAAVDLGLSLAYSTTGVALTAAATVVEENGVAANIPVVPGTEFPVGTSVVRWTATDATGVSGTATQVVTLTGDCAVPAVLGADLFGGYMSEASLTGAGIGGAGSFPPPGALGSDLAYASQAVCARDFDLDGRTDILIANGVTGQVRIYRRTGAGSGAFDIQHPMIVDAATPGGDPRPASCEDIDQDGDVDVVMSFAGTSSTDATKTKLYVYRNSGGGTTFARGEALTGLTATNIPSGLAGKVLIDLNGDSLRDLVVFAPTSQSNAPQLHVFLNQGAGGQPFVAGARTPIGGTSGLMTWGSVWGSLAIADDGDGNADLWAMGNNKKLFFLKGLGGTSFNVPTSPVATFTALSFGYHVMASRDVDGDGLRDLLMTPAYSSADRPLYWYRGMAGGGIVSAPSGSISDWGTNVAVAP